MSSWRNLVALVLIASAIPFAHSQSAAAPGPGALTGLGRVATPAELRAWDIDVRPDLKGLPPGSGSVAKGQDVWEGKCASCHGVFGESGEVFNPLVGGTTQADVASGRVARLTDSAYPGRTTLMKASSVSTLWDYINRAMPWTQPKSLSVEEVYSVTAYLLNMGGVVPDDFTLTDRNMAQVQERMPNRKGMTTSHALWPGAELGGAVKPDVQGSDCMRNCRGEPKVASSLPDHARDAHGNLADQNRLIGPQRGVDTRRPGMQGSPSDALASGTASTAQAATPSARASASESAGRRAELAAAVPLSQKHGCVSCHGVDAKIIGPAFRDIATKYLGRDDAVAYLSAKIVSGGSGVWGAIPMPAQTLPEADARAIAQWLAAGAQDAPARN